MVCPFCLYKKTEVFNSRSGNRINAIWRRRQCPNCGAQFTTYENADPGSILSIKDGRALTPYSHSKLVLELVQICDHRDDIDTSVPYIAATIEQKLFRKAGGAKQIALTKQDISAITAETLQHYDPIAYIKYLARHQKSLSPEGMSKALRRKK